MLSVISFPVPTQASFWGCCLGLPSSQQRNKASELQAVKMSFEKVSQRLSELQETNRQLKDLIERLATIKFQPGSIPLKNDDEDNVMEELKSEIRQILREQFEDFEVLEQDVIGLRRTKDNSELEAQKAGLDQAQKRSMKELKA